MTRFYLFLLNEFKLARTAIPIHMVAILQPSILFLFLSFILVHPTFKVNVSQPLMDEGHVLVEAMEQVGSPIGADYIDPIIVDSKELGDLRQIITVKERDGVPTAVQQYGLIDSNQVKNLRNRLTAAALHLWNAELKGRALSIKEHTWLPYDAPYTVYFGMALLPMAAFVAAAIIGGVLTAQDFELKTTLEYRLSPVSPVLILGARLVRLVLSSLLSACMLLVVAGLVTGFWPGNIWRLGGVLLTIAIMASCMGIILGLLFRSTIPAYISGLSLALAGWIFGGGFALASGFGGVYERISRLTPNAHAVELCFPAFYRVEIGNPLRSALVLIVFSVISLSLLFFTYRWRVTKQAY